MCDTIKHGSSEPQCQFYVLRKKRLCRMTVKPGRQYCGEHEPQPKTAEGQDDTRVPCPNDPKHTCYGSKLEKHLLICNARPMELPPYIEHNINSPADTGECQRRPLSQVPKEEILRVIDKVNNIYDTHIRGNITTEPDRPIHSVVLKEFSEPDRTESSLRHLRQASSLLWLAETEGLVADNTCYVELGAGRGQMTYYAHGAWCGGDAASVSLLVDRASPRHKRDSRLPPPARERLRVDLAALRLARVPCVARAAAIVGLAKHLCGAASDFALRSLCAAEAARKVRGVVLAACCHHRGTPAPLCGRRRLHELGITGGDLNVILSIVSWATCGDGRSRNWTGATRADCTPGGSTPTLSTPDGTTPTLSTPGGTTPTLSTPGGTTPTLSTPGGTTPTLSTPSGTLPSNSVLDETVPTGPGSDGSVRPQEDNRLILSQAEREEIGRRAKHLLDWARVLYLRDHGFDARLTYYVPTSVSLENLCIVAKKLS